MFAGLVFILCAALLFEKNVFFVRRYYHFAICTAASASPTWTLSPRCDIAQYHLVEESYIRYQFDVFVRPRVRTYRHCT